MYENSILYEKEYRLTNAIFSRIYNLNQKIAFIEDKYSGQALSAKQLIIRFFSTTGFIERKLNKDLNKFNSVDK